MEHCAIEHSHTDDLVDRIVCVRRAQSDGEGSLDATILCLVGDHRWHRPVDLDFTVLELSAQLAIVHHDVHRGAELVVVGSRLIADDANFDVIGRVGVERIERSGDLENTISDVVVDRCAEVTQRSPDHLARVADANVVRAVEQLEPKQPAIAAIADKRPHRGVSQQRVGCGLHHAFVGTERLDRHFEPRVARDGRRESDRCPSLLRHVHAFRRVPLRYLHIRIHPSRPPIALDQQRHVPPVQIHERPGAVDESAGKAS